MTLIVTVTLTVAMLWPLDRPPPAPKGKVVHFIAFEALVSPVIRTGRFGLLPVLIGATAFGEVI